LEEAAEAAQRGNLVVFPTDTVYGIGCVATDPAAVQRLFRAKGRSRELSLLVFPPSLAAARGYARFDERADRLSRACWPGSLTMVLPRSSESQDWDLGGQPDTIGLRIPDHSLARALVRAVGPMAVSSANRSGDPQARTCDDLVEAFGEAVEVYLCEEVPLEGIASTVVSLAEKELLVLRSGALSDRWLREVAAGTA
jgi:tRNA threonylcarbamoyl adenosine modification protein (Sua5/YciO/YrdC/YwlC family)